MQIARAEATLVLQRLARETAVQAHLAANPASVATTPASPPTQPAAGVRSPACTSSRPPAAHSICPTAARPPLDAGDTHLTVDLSKAYAGTALTLSRLGFVTAQASACHDTIKALAANHTLTGGGGADTLIGAAATSDTFKDSAAGLNNDTIGGFAGTDAIDVTDLVPGPRLSLAYTQGSGAGVLTLREGAVATTITLLGAFAQTDFTTASDQHGGVLITLHQGG